MKITFFKPLFRSTIFALLAVSAPSHAMMKHFFATTKTVHSSFAAARTLQTALRLTTSKLPQATFAARSTKPGNSLWSYTTLALAAGASGAACAQQNTDTQEIEKTLYLPKNDISLRCSIIPAQEVTKEDIQLLKKVFNETFTLKEFENLTIMRAQIITPEGPLLAGIVVYKQYEWYPEVTYISWLAVHPDHQKKGIGNALIDHIASVTKSHSIGLQATTKALDFYMHVGFKVVTEEDRYLEKKFK